MIRIGSLTKTKSMVSNPYNQIIGVSSEDEGVIFKSSDIILMTAAGNFTFQFRGGDKAHMAYTPIMTQILHPGSPPARGSIPFSRLIISYLG